MLDYYEEEGGAYVIMEYIDGRNLEECFTIKTKEKSQINPTK